jgi:tRNA (cmo5U34)-methyltransferase
MDASADQYNSAAMGAAAHLGINLADYDASIRTLIPHYEDLVEAAASAVDTLAPRAPIVLDLGTGSGALAARVLKARPRARMTGIDEDEGMLELAARRLRGRLAIVCANFEQAALPACDVITASYALHHIRTKRRKSAMYARAFAALKRGGLLVSGDNCLASSPALRAAHRANWIAHLRRFYSPAKAEGFLRAWAKEDVYFTLEDEVAMLRAAGFAVDIAWRRDSFAVIVARR